MIKIRGLHVPVYTIDGKQIVTLWNGGVIAVITNEHGSVVDHEIDKSTLRSLPENEYKKIDETIRISHINYLIFDFLPHMKAIISENIKR